MKSNLHKNGKGLHNNSYENILLIKIIIFAVLLISFWYVITYLIFRAYQSSFWFGVGISTMSLLGSVIGIIWLYVGISHLSYGDKIKMKCKNKSYN
jgi:hypothetical protein